MTDPRQGVPESEPERPSRGRLELRGVLAVSLGVLGRRWLALLVLVLLWRGGPDFIALLLTGQTDLASGRGPLSVYLLYLATTHLAWTVLAATVARVVLADRLRGGEVTPLEALSIGWGRLPELIYAYAIISAGTVGYAVAVRLSGLRDMADMAVAIVGQLVFALSATFFSTTVPIILRENASGWRAVLRAFALTGGFRLGLFTFYAVLAAGSYIVGALLTGLVFDLLAPFAQRGLPLIAMLLTVVWTAGFWVVDAFFLVVSPVLYLALRKAREGAGEGEIEVFA